jgi:hypothetical protein
MINRSIAIQTAKTVLKVGHLWQNRHRWRKNDLVEFNVSGEAQLPENSITLL